MPTGVIMLEGRCLATIQKLCKLTYIIICSESLVLLGNSDMLRRTTVHFFQ